MVGRYWGLSPKITKWIYTAIVRPQITYGAIAWITALNKKHICNKLNSIQRLACKMITSCIHSAPTAGMEILIGLMPLKDHIRLTATNCSTRLARTGHWNIGENERHKKSHVGMIETIREQIPETYYPQDKTALKVRIGSNFEIEIGKREALSKQKVRPMPRKPHIVNCFTDGSKTDIGAGAAYIIKGNQIKAQDYIHLGQYATVFQAEITAISMAAITLLDRGIMGKNINFYVDSQSAIKALQSYTTFMKSVLECKKLVNKVGEANTICINWIPGHTGQLGNEIADRLAKLGADMEADGAEPRVAISQCVIKSATEKWFRNRQDPDRTKTGRTD